MNSAIAGRIFWKEARVQRGLWWWILLLGAFVQIVPTLLGHDWYLSARNSQWFLSVNIVVTCCFAAGSTAIAFAGETEGRTKSLFQRMPLRTSDLLVGKLSWALLGTYALLLILTLSGVLFAGGRSNLFSYGAAAYGNAPTPGESGLAWLMPIPFLLVGVLCSLVLRDVLTTVAVAGIATTAILASLANLNAAVYVLCFAAIAVADVLLSPAWLRDATFAPRLTWRVRASGATAARGHSTFSVRSQIAWKRTVGSLMWKEWQQALGLTLTLLLAGAILISIFAWLLWRSDRRFEMGIGGLIPILLLAQPIALGVAAGHADRRDGAFRLLAHRGVSPNAFWLTKHAVWLGLAVVTASLLLTWEHAMSVLLPLAVLDVGGKSTPLWIFAREAAWATFGNQNTGTAAIIGVVLFDVLLLYSIGALCATIIPSALSALVIAIIGGLGLSLYWTAAASLDFIAWWSVGIVPLILLFASWVRTRDWLVDRGSLGAWGRAALSLAVPLAAVAGAIIVYRVVQIPAVSLPLEVQQTSQPAFEMHPAKQSLFVDAMIALTPRPPVSEMSASLTATGGWKYADEPTRDWVAANHPALRLALLAAKQPPGDFPPEVWRQVLPHGGRGIGDDYGRKSFPYGDRGFGDFYERATALELLLRDAARKLEFENRLPEALDVYLAMARLGDDWSRSNRTPGPYRTPDSAMDALNVMDRWAIHPQQSVELIKRAISQFQQFEQSARLSSSRVLADWRNERRLFEDYVWNGENPDRESRGAAETGFVRWCLPWELLRLQRSQDAVYARVLDDTQLVERELHNRRFVDAALLTFDRSGTPWTWLDTTLWPPSAAVDGVAWKNNGIDIVNRAARARLHFLAWALADYRREHHEFPERLAALVPTYFDWLPVDPWNGADFLYEPQGVPAEIDSDFGEKVKPLQPFVASAGPHHARIEIQRTAGGQMDVCILEQGQLTPPPTALTVPRQLPAPALALPMPESAIEQKAAKDAAKHAAEKRAAEKAKPVQKPPAQSPPGKAQPGNARPGKGSPRKEQPGKESPFERADHVLDQSVAPAKSATPSKSAPPGK